MQINLDNQIEPYFVRYRLQVTAFGWVRKPCGAIEGVAVIAEATEM